MNTKPSVLVGKTSIILLTLSLMVSFKALAEDGIALINNEPLFNIFNDIYDRSSEGETKKLRYYQSMAQSGGLLIESCSLYGEPSYANSWMEKQAKRSVVSTLQYIGLETTTSSIGAYAKKLDLDEEAYKNLIDNLMNNYCSNNITVFSLKKIRQMLSESYSNPRDELVPSVKTSSFATKLFQEKTEELTSKKNEFEQLLKNFRAFCSWGGDSQDYRLLVPYLKNPFIMSLVIKNLSGVKDIFDPKTFKIIQRESSETVQVSCENLICRKTSLDEFRKTFPRTSGSTGLFTDLTKLYCHHFRIQDYNLAGTIPQIKSIIKSLELEDPILETNYFISLMTGVPDAVFSAEKFNQLPVIAKSNIDERWTKWANNVLEKFSKELLFEDSLRIKAEARRDNFDLRKKGFYVDFSVTLGELDRLTDTSDKLKSSFQLKLSKNFLRQMKVKWNVLSADLDLEGRNKFMQETAAYINLLIKDKAKLFRQVMWNEQLSRLITEELMGQLLIYNGPAFDSLSEEVLDIPINFSYGVFALSYLKYRSDIGAGRIKLNL